MRKSNFDIKDKEYLKSLTLVVNFDFFTPLLTASVTFVIIEKAETKGEQI